MSSAIPTSDYHGAHRKPVTAPAMEQWKGYGCTAFVHDVMASSVFPAEYNPCDVMVADLPWRNGYDAFNRRAGIVDGRTYATFMERVAEITESALSPLYLVTGRHALPMLPTPDAVLPMRLNGDDAVAIGYRPGKEANGRYGITQEFLCVLAQRYDCLGDFCCGYGRTARFALRSGKRAVVSDLNPRCIGYIAEHAPEWVQ